MNKVKDAGGGKKEAPGVAGRKKAFENPVDKKKIDKSPDLKKMDKPNIDKKLAEKPAGKKSVETSAGKKSADKPTDVKKGAGKPTDKKSADKPTVVKKSLDNSANKKSAEKSSEKKSAEKQSDKNKVDKLTDKKSAEKPADKKSAEKPTDKKTVEKPADKKKAEKTDTQNAEKAEEAQIIMEDVESDEEPQSYNKIKFHSSKMDLGLRILREEMAHLQDSGNSLSRQIASMYRTFEEMKDEEMKGTQDKGANEDGEDACSDYDQYSNDDVDSQCADTRDDDLDTEDDVNLMSDLETDSSARSSGAKRKRPLKRPPPLQLQEGQQLQSGGSEKDPNDNQIKTGVDFSLPVDSTDDGEQDANSDFYPDFETSDSGDDCSHCLCCSSLASYSSGIPWKYVDKSGSSAPEYDSDSSEYYSDSDDAPLESPMPIYKRLSPFFYQECYAEVEDEAPLSPGPDGERVNKSGIDDEEFPEKRMSPLGCESPRQASSRTSSGPELDELDDHDYKGQGKDKKAKVSKNKNAAVKSKETRKDSKKDIPKSEPLVGSKVRPVIRKDKDMAVKSKKGTKADIPKSEPIKSNKPKQKALPKTADVSAAATDDDDDEPEEPVNVKDRIKNFEVTNKESDTGTFKRKPKPKSLQDQDGDVDEAMDKAKQAVLSELRGNIKDSKGNPKVKPSAKAPPVKSKPSKVAKEQVSGKPPRHVSKSTFEMKIADDGEHSITKRHGSPKIRRIPGQTIEIPVQYLNNRIPTPEGGQVEYTQPDALTFQVRPVAGNMQGPSGGPFIITTSPKVRRKVSKQVVQLADPDDISEQTTLRPEPQGGLPTPISESSAGAGEHHMCPHCHKKAVPHEERKRNVQVLQLQPVDETQLPPPTPATPTPQTTITFEAPPPQQVVRPGRIIKVIPSGRQQMFMQRQPSEEPRSVHFRLNMPVGGQTHGVPIQVGDYIRIPLNRTQARGVRVIFN